MLHVPTFQLFLLLFLLVSQCWAEGNAKHQKKGAKGDANVIEGDILLDTNELMKMQKMNEARQKRAGNGMYFGDEEGNDRLWPNCRIPFKFGKFLLPDMRMVFLCAMEMWERDTCLYFEHVSEEETDFLYLKEGNTCKSYIGRRGGAQNVSLSRDCSSCGNAAHTLGHAIGLWHEDSRWDRDQYIQIHWDNVDRFYSFVFHMVPENYSNVGYDIQSIMHLGPFAYAKDNNPGSETITIRPDADLPELNCTNTLEMGQRETISYKDKKRVNALCNCNFILEEPPCVTPTTSAPETTTSQQPTTLPTFRTPTVPPPSSRRKLYSGVGVALKISNRFGMQCTPSSGCKPSFCSNHTVDTCHNQDHQFQIVNHPSVSSRRLRTGNTVLLRSINSPTNWLDCSNPQKCVISPCTESNIIANLNSFYISNCSKHHFQLRAIRRPLDKVVNTNNKLQFKYSEGSGIMSYLSCNDHRHCKLLEEGDCPGLRALFPRQPKKNGACAVESFSVDILF